MTFLLFRGTGLCGRLRGLASRNRCRGWMSAKLERFRLLPTGSVSLAAMPRIPRGPGRRVGGGEGFGSVRPSSWGLREARSQTEKGSKLCWLLCVHLPKKKKTTNSVWL